MSSATDSQAAAVHGRHVGQVAGHVLDHQLEVVGPLAVRQLVVDLGRLGVHQVGLEGLAVTDQQRVGQRAVAPVDAAPVQLDEEAGHGVEQAIALGHGPLAQPDEEAAVLEGPGQEAGDQDGGVIARTLRQADGPDGRELAVLEGPQGLVLAPCRPQGQLLDGQDLAIDGAEPDEVAAGAHRQDHERHVRFVPRGQRAVPGQGQQLRTGADQPQRGGGRPGHAVSRDRRRCPPRDRRC